MVWMKSYLFYFSVRLGVIIISVLSFISLFVPSIILLSIGLKVLNPILKLFNDDGEFRNYYVVKAVMNKVDNNSKNFMVLLQSYLFAHMLASCLSFYGALKLKKYFLLPAIFFEFGRVIYCFAFHILLMTVSKNIIDLGILIIATLAGGFLILFLGYNWAACVALFQIINLINSERYKALYGDDPFKPLIPKTYNPNAPEKVRVLITPTNSGDMKKHNQYSAPSDAASKYPMPQPQPIISVLPFNNFEHNSNSYRNNSKWQQSQWPTTSVKTPPTAEIYPTLFAANPANRTQKLYHRNDNNYEENYNNWQWSELMPAVLNRNKQNIYKDTNWNY